MMVSKKWIRAGALLLALFSFTTVFAEGMNDAVMIAENGEEAEMQEVAPKEEVTTKPEQGLQTEPTEEQSAEPTEAPSTEPTAEPTAEPSAEPTAAPTAEPNTEPTAEPTVEPSAEPTVEPTAEPSTEPTTEPTAEPSAEPTAEPSAEPPVEPTEESSAEPTVEPTAEPSAEPTTEPTAEPSAEPSAEPTKEPDPVPEEKPEAQPDDSGNGSDDRPPVKPKESYKISIETPEKWKTEKEKVTVKITDLKGKGWKHIRIVMALPNRLITVADREEQDKEYIIEVRENCSIHVTLTDHRGNIQSKSEAVECFDRRPPTVKAGINREFLTIEASDTISGVAAVYINGHRVTYRGTSIDAKIRDYADGKEKLAIQGVDEAGNFSSVVYVQNPFYGEDNRPHKPDPTKKPSSGGDQRTPPPRESHRPAHTATPVPTIVPTPVPTMQPPEVPKLPNVPGAGQGFSMEGNMQTVDLLYSNATHKQFVTLKTKSGETYYKVIDYDKPLDEKGDAYETYFLNLVDDRDLLDVIKPKDMPTPEPSPSPTPKPTPVPQQEPEKPKSISVTDVLLILIACAGGVWLIKNRKTENREPEMMLDDLEDDEEESGEKNEKGDA